MAHGPGRFDAMCSLIREQLGAKGVVLLVWNSPMGSGFSVQGTAEFMHQLPQLFEQAAAEAGRDMQGLEGLLDD